MLMIAALPSEEEFELIAVSKQASKLTPECSI